MEIRYSKLEQSYIKEKKKELSHDVPGTFWEKTKLALIKAPFALLFFAYIYHIIKTPPLWNNFLNYAIKKDVDVYRCLILYVLFIIVILFILYRGLSTCAMIIIKNVDLFALEKNKENKNKLELLNTIDKLLDLQSNIREFVGNEDSHFVLLEESNHLEIIIERDGYSSKREFTLNAKLMESIRESNTLDFTYLDEMAV